MQKRLPPESRIAEEWSTADLYAMLAALPTASPSVIAQTAVRRYGLNSVSGLRRRLAATVHAQRVAQHEVRCLSPLGNLDGPTAIAAVLRIAEWVGNDNRPALGPCE